MQKYVIILFALLISAVVFAENAETDVSMAKITLNTGDVFIGEIIVENEHILMIRTAEGSRFQFPINDIETIQENYAVRRIVVVEQRSAAPPREEVQRPIVERANPIYERSPVQQAVLHASRVRTQGLTFEYSVGYGTFLLRDIHQLQYNIWLQNSWGVRFRIVDDFPAHITHSFALGYMLKQHNFGVNFSYLTTGGRLHRADFSGSYTIDMIMNGYRLGTFYRYYFGNPAIQFYLQLSSGAMFSTLRMEERLQIHFESAEEISTLRGVGIFAEPTIGVSFQITENLRFSLSGGCQLDFLGRLSLYGERTIINARWSGLRLYGSLMFILPERLFLNR